MFNDSNCHCETIPAKSEGEVISEIVTGFALAVTRRPFSDNFGEAILDTLMRLLRPSNEGLTMTTKIAEQSQT